MSRKKHIAALVCINVDYLAKIDRLPEVGTFVYSKKSKISLGGKAVNAAVGLARLGEKIFAIGGIGQDLFCPMLLQTLKNEGVDIDYLRIEKNSTNRNIFLLVDSDGNCTEVVNTEENILITANDIDRLLADVDLGKLSLEYFYLTTELNSEVINYAIEQFNKRKITIFCDGGPFPERILLKRYLDIDFLILNSQEASKILNRQIEDLETATEAAKLLRSWGTKNIVITLGGKGGIYISEEMREVKTFSALATEVIDVTAAGDAFRAGLIHILLDNNDLGVAVSFANKCGAYAVSRLGGYESLPKSNDLNDQEPL